LSTPVDKGWGRHWRAEYLANRHGISASNETVRQWMMRAKLWRGKRATVDAVFWGSGAKAKFALYREMLRVAGR